MDGVNLALVLAAHLVLTALPGVAVALYAARRGVRSVPVLLALALATIGAAGLLGYWAYYGSRVLGETFTYFTLIGSAGLTGWVLYERRLDPALLRELATPLLLWALGSAFLVALGFGHGGYDHPTLIASTRFGAGQLPSDAGIPLFFGEWVFQHGHAHPPIFLGEWLSSDRPPLQAGFYAWQRPFAWGNNEVHYEVLSVALQQLWIVGLWALLVAAKVGRVTRALALAAVLLSGFAILNGFFVWPKLLPAAMLLAVAALVLTPLWSRLRTSLGAAALIGALVGLAMMGHGSSIFGIVPLAAVAAYRGLPSWRFLGVAVLIGVAVIAPWSAYQKYADPPGNRLLKWQLGGVVEIDQRGTGETIVDSYREAGLGGALHDKAENAVTILGGGPAWKLLRDTVHEAVSRRFGTAIKDLRAITFFYLVPSLGLLLLGPLAMLFWRRRRRQAVDEWSFALSCLVTVAIGAFTCALVLFGNEPARAVIHVDSYLLPALAICGAVVGLRAVAPRFGLWLVGINCLLTLALYLPSFEPYEGTAYSPWAYLLVAASLAGFVATSLRGAPAPRLASDSALQPES
jgi:hypothetical protein